MTVTATGPLSRPFALAAELLAASTTFRTLVGAADATEALEYIDYPYRDLEAGDYLIPGAYLFDDPQLTQFQERLGAQGGQLGLMLCAEKSAAYAADAQNDLKEWRNLLGAILTEMKNLANSPTPGGGFYWSLTRWEKDDIGWQQKSEAAMDADPAGDKTFRVGVFVLHWV